VLIDRPVERGELLGHRRGGECRGHIGLFRACERHSIRSGAPAHTDTDTDPDADADTHSHTDADSRSGAALGAG
jgi:hypothetical protein